MKDKKNQPEKEIEYEEEINSDDFQNKIKKIKEKLKETEKEKQEYLDGWQRSKADFINYKKQVQRDREDSNKYATEEFVAELLPALDSFEMAFKNKKAWEEVPLNWRSGVEYIYNQLINILELKGVVILNPLNEPFDPQKHNSIDSILTKKAEEEGIILEVVLKGYRLYDRIIRPPSVKVGKLE